MARRLNPVVPLVVLCLYLVFTVTLVAAELDRIDTLAKKASLFNWEHTQLTSEELETAAKSRFHRSSRSHDHGCKVFPGDEDWPSHEDWNVFNETLNGALLRPIPQSSVCYNSTAFNDFNPSQCAAVTANFDMYVPPNLYVPRYSVRSIKSDINSTNDPVEALFPVPAGLTCLPPNLVDTKGCKQVRAVPSVWW